MVKRIFGPTTVEVLRGLRKVYNGNFTICKFFSNVFTAKKKKCNEK
jgi:hypothetical protein